jgi:hypothetical protein
MIFATFPIPFRNVPKKATITLHAAAFVTHQRADNDYNHCESFAADSAAAAATCNFRFTQ